MTLPMTLSDANHSKSPLILYFGLFSISFKLLKPGTSNLVCWWVVASTRDMRDRIPSNAVCLGLLGAF